MTKINGSGIMTLEHDFFRTERNRELTLTPII